MDTLTEGQRTGEFLVSEAQGSRSREAGTLITGQNLKAGAVLGLIAASLAAPVGAAAAGNTGDGTIGTLTAGTGVQTGVYTVTFIEPAANLGTFTVEDPAGVEIGTGTVGSAFAGEVNFTISDGAADFVAGDQFTVTVAPGSGKYTEYDPTNNDGSQAAVAVLWGNVDATLADVEVAIIARDAEVNAAELQWFTGASGPQISTGQAELAAQGIIAR